MDLHGPKPLPQRSASLEAGDVEKVRDLVAAVTGAAVPASPFALALHPFAAALLAAMPEPPAGAVLVHEALGLERPRPLPVGRALAIGGRREPSGGGEILTLEATSAGEPVARLSARVNVAPASLLARPGPMRRPDRAPALSVSVTAAQVEKHAALSGDFNPIHTDLAAAHALGLPERVVHGTMLAFLIEPALEAANIAAAPVRLGLRFVSPALIGERLDVHVAADHAQGRPRVSVTGPGGALRCVADVSIGV
jgi:acyl dehydratase